jgi:phosphatidylglycerol:prolipoprotein diacylglycerol transferase
MPIDPIIYEFTILGLHIALRWYGLLVGIGVMIGAWVLDREITHRGGNSEPVWDMLTWIVVGGIAGARLWYVLNDVFGGGTYFTQNPGKILAITEGGLHIYGAVVGGFLVFFWMTRERVKYDNWLFLDAVAPALLIGQAAARPANFINQELYGPPTELPWGIKIDGAHRLAEWADLTRYPVDTTRFHPAFAYEMVWNLMAGGLIIWLTRRFPDQLKPGSAFFLWLILAGLGRFLIEFFRPDQPRIPGTPISITRAITVLMMTVGGLLLAHRLGRIQLPWAPKMPDNYSV